MFGRLKSGSYTPIVGADCFAVSSIVKLGLPMFDEFQETIRDLMLAGFGLLVFCLPVSAEEIVTPRESGGILYSTTVENGQLQSVYFELTERDIAGPHSRRRYWKDHPAIDFTLAKYRGSGLHRAHIRALSQTSKADGDATNSTLNIVAAYPSVNQSEMRLVERYIESVVPCSVKFIANYDGKGRHIDGCEVPDSFVYVITSERMQSRFVIQNEVGR